MRTILLERQGSAATIFLSNRKALTGRVRHVTDDVVVLTDVMTPRGTVDIEHVAIAHIVAVA